MTLGISESAVASLAIGRTAKNLTSALTAIASETRILPIVLPRNGTAINRLRRVTVISGDGIGSEVVDAAVCAIKATGVLLEWDYVELSASAIGRAAGHVPQKVLESLRRTRVGLKGPVWTCADAPFQSLNVALRQELNLFANYRAVRSLPALKTRITDVQIDLAIFRENTESMYSGLEDQVTEDLVESKRVITRRASLRIAQSAFDFARRHRRRKLTVGHKANVLKLSDGLFLRCCREVAHAYPEIEYQELVVDNSAMQLVLHPESFDVLLTPNRYGDILSDLATGLVGGLGLVPGANLGDAYAVFEGMYGSSPDIAGLGIANPTALMRAGAMLLMHIGEPTAASRLSTAIDQVYADGTTLTRDVGGSANTSDFTEAIIDRLRCSYKLAPPALLRR
jgi:isocitrate dehydrogenase (NAD+)